MYLFLCACMSILPLLNATSDVSFWLKRKRSDGTAVSPLPWPPHSCHHCVACFITLSVRGVYYFLCHFLPNKVLRHTKSRQIWLCGHYGLYLKTCLHPKVALLAGPLSPASVSFPQEGEPVLPLGLSSLWRNEAFTQHYLALI